VLWPFRVVGDVVLARRWLYNAITRAKRRAIVIVEDPQKRRLNAPPFAYPTSDLKAAPAVPRSAGAPPS
jgi:ATP-dependent exoDNAse (exonuclease V) alpha subunit